jgi:hypothetical protein
MGKQYFGGRLLVISKPSCTRSHEIFSRSFPFPQASCYQIWFQSLINGNSRKPIAVAIDQHLHACNECHMKSSTTSTLTLPLSSSHEHSPFSKYHKLLRSDREVIAKKGGPDKSFWSGQNLHRNCRGPCSPGCATFAESERSLGWSIYFIGTLDLWK